MTNVGIGLNGVKTYGELCEAIENTKKAIHRVKKDVFYEQGDEMDLELHLIHLIKVKLYNDKEDELCMVCCNKCESNNVEREKQYIFETGCYEYKAFCQDCGYHETHTVNRLFNLNDWVEKNWIHHMPHDL